MASGRSNGHCHELNEEKKKEIVSENVSHQNTSAEGNWH